MTHGMMTTVLGCIEGIDVLDYMGKSFDDVVLCSLY